MESYGLCVVLLGSIATGFQTVGPFGDGTEAIDWCEKHDQAWEVMPIVAPDVYLAELAS